METKTIRVRRSFYHDKEIQPVGKILTVPAKNAREYESANKVEIIPDPPPIEKKIEKSIPDMRVDEGKEKTLETKTKTIEPKVPEESKSHPGLGRKKEEK